MNHENLPAVVEPDVRAVIGTELPTLQARVEALEVVSPVTHAEAGTLLRYVGGKRALWAAHMDPHIEGAREAKRIADRNRARLVEEKEQFDEPLAKAEAVLASRILAYEASLAAEAVAEQARRQALADAQAEEQALQTAISIEQEALAAPTPEDAAFFHAEAEAVLGDVAAPTVRLARPVPKVKGLAPTATWHAEVVDLKALLEYFLRPSGFMGGPDPVLQRELKERIVEAVLVPLNKRAVASQNALRIPGVRAVRVDSYQMRRRS